jgi:serine/threonine protein kinase
VEQPGAIFDDSYEIVGELGRGTTGTVYEARHTRIDRRVALKVPDLSAGAERQERAQRFLHRECRALAYLTGGPDCRIPRLLAVTEHPAGHPYSVRELVAGSTLEQRAADGSIDLRDGLGVVAEVARVVQWIHDQGFAHRNLSPANVLISRDGAPWLIGFGRVGFVAGSPMLPAGASGTPAAVDVRGLRELLCWLCGTLRQPIPDGLDRAAAITPGAFAETVAGHL